MDMDTNEITINRIVGFQWDEPGTDVEDERPTPTSSPAQNGFDLDLAKVMLDVSVMPALTSPIEESEVPPTSEAAEYAAPETPTLETVIESPGYAVPGELTFSWVPGYVPGAATVSEEGQTLSTGHPPSGVGRNTGRRFRNHGSVPPDHAVAPEDMCKLRKRRVCEGLIRLRCL